MEEGKSGKLVSYLWTGARLFLGFLIPVPFLLLTQLAVAINNTYFPDEITPLEVWIENLFINGPAVVVGALVMFYKFRSPVADRWATYCGAAILVAIVILLAWTL